jgi:hypothetical protein
MFSLLLFIAAYAQDAKTAKLMQELQNLKSQQTLIKQQLSNFISKPIANPLPRVQELRIPSAPARAVSQPAPVNQPAPVSQPAPVNQPSQSNAAPNGVAAALAPSAASTSTFDTLPSLPPSGQKTLFTGGALICITFLL